MADPNLNQPDAAHAWGELPLSLVREWTPLLKPTGSGLLLTIHAWEDTNPRSPFYGWMHASQERLAAYCDTGRTTIIRYRDLLKLCGLIEERQVSDRRSRMKLHQNVYRVNRAPVLPSHGLLEYLLFDADEWTRKHTAWLLTTYQPLVEESELGRLLAAMRRSYETQLTSSGTLEVVSGKRLSEAHSFAARLLGQQLGQQATLPVAIWQAAAPLQRVAPAADNTALASHPQPTIVSAVDSATLVAAGYAHTSHSSVPSVNNAVPPYRPTASSDVPPGVSGPGSAVSPGVSNNVNVDSVFNVKDHNNVNVASDHSNLLAIATSGAQQISDEHSLNWHLVCATRLGVPLYQQLVSSTRKALDAGKVKRGGAYFTKAALAAASQRGLALESAASKSPGNGNSQTDPAGVLQNAPQSWYDTNHRATHPPPASSDVSAVNNASSGFVSNFSGYQDSVPATHSTVASSNVPQVNNAIQSGPHLLQPSNVPQVNNAIDTLPGLDETSSATARQLWCAVQYEMQGRLSNTAWQSWLSQTRVVGREDGTLLIGGPSSNMARAMVDRYGEEVVTVAHEMAGRKLPIRFVARLT